MKSFNLERKSRINAAYWPAAFVAESCCLQLSDRQFQTHVLVS